MMRTKKETKTKKFQIHLLSDSSGNLLAHFLHALLTQYPKRIFRIRVLPFLTTPHALREALSGISRGILLHGFVKKELKDIVRDSVKGKPLRAWDVTGPTAQFLHDVTGVRPQADPGVIHSVNTSYMDRMQAVEYALQHDDSRRSDALSQADIILVGISRVSKSPNASFLGYQGFKVANVTLVPEHGLPEPLKRHRKKNVAALTIQPKRLAEIRGRRFDDWHIDKFDYTDLRAIIREVMEAEQIYRAKKWPLIDTTDLAVEETSALVLKKLGLKPKFFG